MSKIVTEDNLKTFLKKMNVTYGPSSVIATDLEKVNLYVYSLDYDLISFRTDQTLTGSAASDVLSTG